MKNIKTKILSTGVYLPERIYTNQYLSTISPTNAQWVSENLGIKERRIVDMNQCTSDLAFRAGLNAIENAGLKPNDIQLIIVATTTPDRLAPSTATITQEKMKIENAAAFDILAVCSGFLFGMCIGSQFINNGMYKNVLIIGADTPSRITNWSKRDCVFFGDGAGAMVLSTSYTQIGFQKFYLQTNGKGLTGFSIPGGGSQYPASYQTIEDNLHTFKMNGKQVYQAAIKYIPQSIFKVLEMCKLTIQDIDLLIPHQPNIKILKKVSEIIGMPFQKVIVNLNKYANTIAGTIPIALHQAIKERKIKMGQTIIFSVIGAGWTWGSGVYKC